MVLLWFLIIPSTRFSKPLLMLIENLTKREVLGATGRGITAMLCYLRNRRVRRTSRPAVRPELAVRVPARFFAQSH
jgi:hypothetical protein